MKKLGFILLIGLFACGASNEQHAEHSEQKKLDPKVATKKAEVMEVHDVAMARMDEMRELKKQLTTLQEADTSNVQVAEAIAALEEANKAMFDWMHNYSNQFVDTSAVENAIPYLENQLESAQQMAEKINTSIENGKALL